MYLYVSRYLIEVETRIMPFYHTDKNIGNQFVSSLFSVQYTTFLLLWHLYTVCAKLQRAWSLRRASMIMTILCRIMANYLLWPHNYSE